MCYPPPYNNRFDLNGRGRHALCGGWVLRDRSKRKGRAGTPFHTSFPGRLEGGHRPSAQSSVIRPEQSSARGNTSNNRRFALGELKGRGPHRQSRPASGAQGNPERIRAWLPGSEPTVGRFLLRLSEQPKNRGGAFSNWPKSSGR